MITINNYFKKIIKTKKCFIFLLVSLIGLSIFNTGCVGGRNVLPKNPPSLIDDGTGGVIMVWVDQPQDHGIKVQHIDAKGNLLWKSKGILITNDETLILPRLISDGYGGVIIYWESESDNKYLAQHLNSNGDFLWDKKGLPLEQIPSEFAPIPDISGLELIYGVNIVSVSNTLETIIYKSPIFKALGYSRVIDDGEGGVIVASRTGDGKSVGRTYSVYAQRINAKGELLWGDGGLEIQHVMSSPLALGIMIFAILFFILIIFGIYRKFKIALTLTIIGSFLIGSLALFCTIILISYSHNPLFYLEYSLINRVIISIIAVTSFILAITSLLLKTQNKWKMAPLMLYSLVVLAIVGFITTT